MKIIISEIQFSDLVLGKLNPNKIEIIFMGGLDDKPGYYNLNQQSSLLQNGMKLLNLTGLGKKFSLSSFRYNQVNEVASKLKKNPDAYLILFSKACEQAGYLSSLIKNKNRMFIVEPQAIQKKEYKHVTDSVKTAVSNGVPTKNVIVGDKDYRGLGVVQGATPTPK